MIRPPHEPLAAAHHLCRRLLVLMCGVFALQATSAQELRFRNPADSRLVRANAAAPLGLTLSDEVLSRDEKAFIAALPELRVAVRRGGVPPYEVVSADGEVSGIHPELLAALARTFGLRIKPVPTADWDTTLQALRERRVDVVMSVGVTAERLGDMAFTLGVTPWAGGVFTRGNEPVELNRARFAQERGRASADWVHRYWPDARLVPVDSATDALRAVADGRADAMLGSILEVSELLARQPREGAITNVQLLRTSAYGTGYYHFAVRKDLAPLAAILNKGIHGLRASAGDQMALALPPNVQMPRPLPLNSDEARLLTASGVWRVGAVRGLALLNDVDANGVHSGIGAEYSEQVARRLGVAVQLMAYPSVAAMLEGLAKGEIDHVPFLTRTPERAQQFAFSAPYVEMPYSLVARTDSPHWWSLESLRGKRLALAALHPLREVLAAQFPDIQIVDAANGNAAMDAVVRREADAAVEVKLFANLRVNSPDGESLRVLGQVDELPAQFHFATLKGDAVRLQLINRALADIDPGERQRMMRRWVAVDLTPAFPWRRYAPTIVVTLAALLLAVIGTVVWGRRLKREVVARQRSEGLLTDIATQMPGVAFRYVVDGDNRLRHHWYTPGAKAFLGVEPDARTTLLHGLTPHLHPDDVAEAAAAQARSQASGEPFQCTVRFRHPAQPDAGWRWLHAKAVMTGRGAGRTVWTGYIVDVTTERELQQRLAREAESRSLMLASASHELRAPTHTLSLALQAMPQQGLSEPQHKALQVAQDAANTLAELLNDVLDAARDAAAHDGAAGSTPTPLRLRVRSFDLHQLLGDLGRAWRAGAASKGLRFECELAADVPRTITTDPLRLKQVLINLLSNACKYTEAGSVTLRAALGDEGGTRSLQLSVADTGIGITPAEQSKLFQPFATADDAQAAPLAGAAGRTGLGLAMSRRVAALLGGTLSLCSTPGQGTTVTLTLPLQPEATAAPLAGGAVLVCDDDDTSRVLMAQMLRLKGFATHETGASTEALDLWRAGGVRALVSDLDMPGMSGLELIRTLRAEERGLADGSRTVVIVCSGSPVPAADAGGNAALYDAYLVKPVQVSTLTDTLQRLGVAA